MILPIRPWHFLYGMYCNSHSIILKMSGSQLFKFSLTSSSPATSLSFSWGRIPIQRMTPYRERPSVLGTSVMEPTSKPWGLSTTIWVSSIPGWQTRSSKRFDLDLGVKSSKSLFSDKRPNVTKCKLSKTSNASHENAQELQESKCTGIFPITSVVYLTCLPRWIMHIDKISVRIKLEIMNQAKINIIHAKREKKREIKKSLRRMATASSTFPTAILWRLNTTSVYQEILLLITDTTTNTQPWWINNGNHLWDNKLP